MRPPPRISTAPGTLPSPVCPKEETGRWILHVGAVTFNGYSPLAVKPAPVVGPNVSVPTLSPGDILVSRSNTRERVGLAGIYNGSPFPCSYPDLLMRVRVGQEIMPEFLEAVLLSDRGRCYFSTSARGTSETMVKINRATLEEFPIQLPPIDEQENIVTWLLAPVGIRSESPVSSAGANRRCRAPVFGADEKRRREAPASGQGWRARISRGCAAGGHVVASRARWTP